MSKITVLVAVYNAERYLEQCLNSLCNQSLGDVQIVCIDDCSTDRSPLILKQFAETDERITVLHTPVNSGQAVARNLGLSVANGEFTTFLDSDDYLAPTSLEQVYRALKAEPEADCALMDVVMVDEATGQETHYANQTSQRKLTGEVAFDLCLNHWHIHGVYVVRTDIHKRYPYDTTCRTYSDDNTTRFHYLHSRQVLLTPAPYFYRQHAASATHQCSLRRFDQLEANLSMRYSLLKEAELGTLPHAERTLRTWETQRYTNLIGIYGYWLCHRKQLRPEEQAEALARMKQCFSTIERKEIAANVKYRPFYFPWRRFGLFTLQARVYFALRSLLEFITKLGATRPRVGASGKR